MLKQNVVNENRFYNQTRKQSKARRRVSSLVEVGALDEFYTIVEYIVETTIEAKQRHKC